MAPHDTAAGFAVKAVPPAGVGGLSLLGYTLPEWVVILTLIYTALNIITLIKDKYVIPFLEARRARRRTDSADDSK